MANDILFKASADINSPQSFQVSADAQKEVSRLLKDAGDAANRNDLSGLTTIAELITEPIITVVDYNEAFADILTPVSAQIGDDLSYPLDVYDSQSFQVSADGEVLTNRVPGVLYASPSPFRIETGFEIYFDDLVKARFDLVGRRMIRAAQELARRRDAKVKAALDTAASSLTGHVVLESSGSLTKASVDAIIAAAAYIGYDILNVKINVSDVLSMRNWSGANTFAETDGFSTLFARTGYYGEYGGANWQVSKEIQGRKASVQDGAVYFLAAPDRLGYRHEIGGMRSLSGQFDRQRIAWWSWDQEMAVTVVNPLAVFKVIIAQ